MPLPLALGIASLFLTGVSVLSQIQASGDAKDIAEEQKAQSRADRALAEMRNRRSKVEELRKSRIARAQIINQAEQTGTGISSGVAGGTSAIQSQTASNVGFLNAVNTTSQKIFESNQRATDLTSSMNQKMAFASITGTLGQTFSPGIKEVFKSKSTT